MPLSVFAAAAEAPDRPALITDRLALTFGELAERVRRVVAGLRARADLHEGPIAMVAENDLTTLVRIHALVALGTPALLLHPRLTRPERTALVESTGAVGTLGSGEPPDAPRDPGPDPVVPPPDERSLAIVPTSGTGGAPRGVVLSRRAFRASATASAANLGWIEEDRWLLPLPVAHVGGLSIVTRCLLARRPVVLATGAEPGALVEAVSRHRVTLLSLVPTMLSRILRLEPGALPPEHLRAVLLGGAAAPPALLEEAADRGWPVLTTYGLTEGCSQVTTQTRGTVNRGELGSGRPLPGVELRIGRDDVIEIRGPTLFSAYVPAADHPPLLPGGWFSTGDRGRLDEAGNLHVLGRRGDRIVTGGENVDPAEVERALEQIPAVVHACVFGAPDPEWGEVVCAAVVARATGDGPGSTPPDETAVLEAVRSGLAGLRAELAPFKLPRRAAVLPALPLNPTGKVDRRETALQAESRLRAL